MATPNPRRRWSNALLLVGAAVAFVGCLSAISVIGLVILSLVPLPFSAAAALARTRWRVVAALFVWGCWFLGLYHVLT